MEIHHITEQENRRTRTEIDSLLDEAREMEYDSVLIIGIKNGEIFSAHCAKSKLQLLGALELVSHDFKDINF